MAIAAGLFIVLLTIDDKIGISGHGSASNAQDQNDGNQSGIVGNPTRTPKPTRTPRPTKTPQPTKTPEPTTIPIDPKVEREAIEGVLSGIVDGGLSRRIAIEMTVAVTSAYYSELYPIEIRSISAAPAEEGGGQIWVVTMVFQEGSRKGTSKARWSYNFETGAIIALNKNAQKWDQLLY